MGEISHLKCCFKCIQEIILRIFSLRGLFFMCWRSNFYRSALILRNIPCPENIKVTRLHIAIIILSRILYLVYVCPCLGLGLFVSCLCDLFFSLIFIVINHITCSFKQTSLFFVHFLEYFLLFLNDDVMKKANYFETPKVQPQVVNQLLLDFLSISA